MSAVVFDTLKFASKLELGGFSKEQARAAAEAFGEAANEQLVTENTLKHAELRFQNSVEMLKSEIFKLLFTQTVVILGAVFAMLKFVK